MSFWLVVTAAYGAVLCVGFVVGGYLARGFRHRGGGGGGGGAPLPDVPPGPTYGAAFPPLGSPFDRALLPGVAFDDVRASRRHLLDH
jgi:hypothetical protein